MLIDAEEQDMWSWLTIGDAFLKYLLRRHNFVSYERLDEGQLTRKRSAVVICAISSNQSSGRGQSAIWEGKGDFDGGKQMFRSITSLSTMMLDLAWVMDVYQGWRLGHGCVSSNRTL